MDAEVIIAGAGLAGSAAAAILGKHGYNIVLVDPRPSCPPVFKAEKIEADQAEMLRKLGLLDAILPLATEIREVRSFHGTSMFARSIKKQYGVYYHEMVDAFRMHLPEKLQVQIGRVVGIRNGSEQQVVTLDNGTELRCRLLVLASGINGDVVAGLGLKREWVRRHQSIAAAFHLAEKRESSSAFNALTLYSQSKRHGLDYLSLFGTAHGLRANLFAFPPRSDAWIRDFVRAREQNLHRAFTHLRELLGDCEITGAIATARIHLYRTEEQLVPGVVLIGDAGQNVCPSTGMGLSKILTDLEVLSECVPRWLGSQTTWLGVEKIAEFCQDPRKLATDAKALRDANYRRQAVTNATLRWKIHRARLRWDMAMAQRRLRSLPGAAAALG